MNARREEDGNRPRANSTGLLKEYIKRKRAEKTEAEEGKSEEASQKSKKIARSPTNIGKEEGKDVTEETMEEILKAIERMRKEMKEGFEENKQEMKRLQEEMERKEKVWKMEKQQLKDRIGKLEEMVERKERQKKKNNIIIKGLRTDNDQGLKEKVEEFISKEVGVKVTVNEAFKIGKNEDRKAIIAKIETWQQKKDIMENKRKLKGKKIIIDNDLTAEEMDIQKKIREIAKEEERTGSRTKIGYKKIKINDIWYEWDNSNKELKPKN